MAEQPQLGQLGESLRLFDADESPPQLDAGGAGMTVAQLTAWFVVSPSLIIGLSTESENESRALRAD